MSNSKPQTPTNKKAPLTQAQLDRMAKTPCKNILQTGECSHGDRCYFKHDNVGGCAVSHHPTSHKQLPPKKPAPPTEAEIVESFLKLEGIGGLSMFLIKQAVEKLPMVRRIKLAIEQFEKIHKTFESEQQIDNDPLIESINEAFSLFNGFQCLEQIIDNYRVKILNSETPAEIRKKFVLSLLDRLKLPEAIDEILRSFDAERASYATAVASDPLTEARANPDTTPSPEFLEHLANACGLSENTGFKDMCRTHETLKQSSPYIVKHFLDILSLYEATNQAEKLLREQNLEEIAERQIAEARVELRREHISKKNPHLKLSFMLLQSQSELVKFIQGLSLDNRETLVSVFGSFMAYLSQIFEKNDTQITSTFLSNSFEKFTKSRRVDVETQTLKSDFFKLVETPIFDELLKTLHVETNSLHGSQEGEKRTPIMVHELLKYMLTDLLSLYDDKVPVDKREIFRKGLVKALLPFAFLISLSPRNSNMLAGRWQRGQKNKQGNEVNHFIVMQSKDAKKSILYWLLSHLKSKSKKKSQPDVCDTFEKLASQFTHQVEMINSDGSKETKQVFSPDLLFDALKTVQCENFLNSVDFDENLKNINPEWLGTIFKIDEQLVSVNDAFPDVLLSALFYTFGSKETDVHTRQFSDMKALMHMRPNCILEVVQSCQEFRPDYQVDPVIQIMDTLGFKDEKSLEDSLTCFLKLISENKSEDLLRRAYDDMSFATLLSQIHNYNGFFMSLIDSLLVVLLSDKFREVKKYDIMNDVYEMKAKSGSRLFMNFPKIEKYMQDLNDGDNNKPRLMEFLSKGKRERTEMKEIVKSIRGILCLESLPNHSFHEEFKRTIPFLLSPSSLAALSKTVPEFELDIPSFSQHHDCSAGILEKIKSFFDTELDRFISAQNGEIQRNLKLRMEQIKEIPAIVDRIKALSFTKHVSAIVNLVNAMFSTLALPYKLENDDFVRGFPSTKDLNQSQSAISVLNHVLSNIGVIKPEKPENPETPADSDPKVPESGGKSGKKSKTPTELDPTVLAEFTLQMDKFTVISNIVSRAISAIYRTEIPKEEVAESKKVLTIKLIDLKENLRTCQTLIDLFNKCLPYWKSPLVRELILYVLFHKFQSGEDCVRELYRDVQIFGFSFEDKEISEYSIMFLFLNDADARFSNTENYDTSDDDILTSMKDTINSDFWNDSNATVEISSPVVQENRKVLLRRRLPVVDSGMSFGGCSAPEPEEVVEDEDEVVEEAVSSQSPVVPKTLYDMLFENKIQDAISYMKSCLLQTETETELLEYLRAVRADDHSVMMDAFREVYGES